MCIKMMAYLQSFHVMEQEVSYKRNNRHIEGPTGMVQSHEFENLRFSIFHQYPPHASLILKIASISTQTSKEWGRYPEVPT